MGDSAVGEPRSKQLGSQRERDSVLGSTSLQLWSGRQWGIGKVAHTLSVTLAELNGCHPFGGRLVDYGSFHRKEIWSYELGSCGAGARCVAHCFGQLTGRLQMDRQMI